MKKQKNRMIIELSVLGILIVLGVWYLFMDRRITDASDGVVSREEGTRSLMVYFSIRLRSGKMQHPGRSRLRGCSAGSLIWCRSPEPESRTA